MSDVSNLDEQSTDAQDEQDVRMAAEHLDPARLSALAEYARRLLNESA